MRTLEVEDLLRFGSGLTDTIFNEVKDARIRM